jgi:N-acetylmuramoyl-L-alanine amidase
MSDLVWKTKGLALRGPSRFPARSHAVAFLLLLSGVMMLLVCGEAGLALASNREKPVIAYAADLEATPEKTALTLHFYGEPDARVFFMRNPARLVLEVENAVFSFADDAAPTSGGVFKNFRHGRISANKSRLVADLAETVTVDSKTLTSGKDDRYLLSLVLKPASEEAFQAAVGEQQRIYGNSGEAVVKGDRVRAPPKAAGRIRIVIDPGHGGIDGGASGKSTVEKHLVLSVAKKIGARIEIAGPFDVFFTRENDVFVSLSERQRFTRRHDADLLISVHADSLRQHYVRGATIYTLAKRASDALAQQVENSENLADVVAGLAAPENQDEVTDILADLTLRETTVFSRSFSSQLVETLKGRVRLINNPERSAAFTVLKNAEVPGILLELGYLSNREDEKLMNDPEWQNEVAGYIADAVAEFFGPRLPMVQAN